MPGKQLDAFPKVGGQPARLVDTLVKQREQMNGMKEKARITEAALIEHLTKMGKKVVRTHGRLVTLVNTSPSSHIKITTPKGLKDDEE
jgi:hypothetical protein